LAYSGCPSTNAEIPAEVSLARWLLAWETGERQDAAALPEAAERACQKLCWRLATLVTMEGSQALLARALHLARAEFPFLIGVQAGLPPAVCLDGLRDSAGRAEPAEVRAGLTTVFAKLIGLLATFIGKALAWQLVRDVWPDAPAG
jgi:hypothetical protein